jgi:hypothetical protein
MGYVEATDASLWGLYLMTPFFECCTPYQGIAVSVNRLSIIVDLDVVW